MKTERIEIVRITIDTEHYVDIVPSGDSFECWIHKTDIGTAHLMYGLVADSVDDVINIVKSTAEDYLEWFVDNDED